MSSESKLLKEQYNISKELLGFTLAELQENEGYLTAKEIAQQPRLWQKTWQLVYENKEKLSDFLRSAFAEDSLTVVLTGAGTSAFIGNVLQGPFQKHTKKTTTAIATTDLILHPEQYLNKSATLLISFARSGDSPESLAAVNIADEYCEKVYHLIITCNPEGQLALSSVPGKKTALVFLLPPEADDQSLAMTGSFTSMLLAGLLIARIADISLLRVQVDTLSQFGENILENYSQPLRSAARLDFQRVVFLGSGPLRWVANESDLKVQELTDGTVICKSDSFLGFRHGPKAVINAATLLVYLFSNNAHVYRYENDLVKAVSLGERGLYRIGVIETAKKGIDTDLLIELSSNGESVDEEMLSVVSVLPAQLLGFYKSLELGLSPDKPSKKETITRVVRGVTIYPFSE
ncbi:D-galactosamine-6-phosphate deaminase AgaS [Dyadobacter sp. CECT 9275]|uniref:D-galactosamine-6-phosphate deaminase AgaS n=1 Tax=Dyadobacter helix TaxID=2822344 RepID=A0A916JC00_9BACT|nr:SIS domain-containing protein [Dyadobacter sp. CECT 9275]CAG5000847.1 D-galactosamine-6-phosphate deaminase AgaS [Dyadobacter sp. CECT 9275]